MNDIKLSDGRHLKVSIAYNDRHDEPWRCSVSEQVQDDERHVRWQTHAQIFTPSLPALLAQLRNVLEAQVDHENEESFEAQQDARAIHYLVTCPLIVMEAMDKS